MTNPRPQWTGAAVSAAAATDEDILPFARHHAVARALLHTFREALEPQIAARGTISREEFARAVELMMGTWPRALPLFARVCRGCAEGTPESPAAEPVDTADERRRDFVTRLLFSTVVRHVPESRDPVTGEVFPRVVAPGLQANLAALFYDKEWEAMNADARSIFLQVRSDSDAELWARITRHATLPVLTHALFVRVMLRFKQFQLQRQTFIRRMAGATEPCRFCFTEEHFDQLFEALFGHLRDEICTELGRARMDVRYGDETSGHLLRIFDAFDTLRRQRLLPVRGLGGAVRTARVPAQARR